MQMQTRLNFQRLRCNKTTEAGDDEVYFIIVRTTSEGGYTVLRFPNWGRHWNMNDGDNNREVGQTNVIQVDLDEGERTNIAVVIMEEDGGIPGDLFQRIGDGLVASGNAYAEAVGAVLEVVGGILNGLNVVDTDDVIGAFGVEYARVKGSLTGLHWERGDSVVQTEADRPDLPAHNCRIEFNGDGSYYIGDFYVDVI